MYFDLYETFKDIEKNDSFKFFTALIKKGWEFDFYNSTIKLKKKDFTYILKLAPVYLSGATLEVMQGDKSICGGQIEDLYKYGLMALDAAIKKGSKIAKKAIAEKEEYYIKTCFCI